MDASSLVNMWQAKRIIRIMKVFNISSKVFLISVIITLTSCSKQDGDEPAGFEREDALSGEYEAEFNRLVTDRAMNVRAVQHSVNELCEKIRESSSNEESVRLYDRLLEKATTYVVDEKNYTYRQNWYRRLTHIAMCAFAGAQRALGNDCKYWDKMFDFFKKYAMEIESARQEYMAKDCKDGRVPYTRRSDYIRGLRSDLKGWIHVMRDLKFPRLSQGLTEEQKADILRRFDELQKYTAEPPDCAGGKAVPK